MTKLERIALRERTLSPEKVTCISTDGEGEIEGSMGYKSVSERTGEGEKVKSWEKSRSVMESFIFIKEKEKIRELVKREDRLIRHIRALSVSSLVDLLATDFARLVV